MDNNDTTIIPVDASNAERFYEYFPGWDTELAEEEGFLGFGLLQGDSPRGAILATCGRESRVCDIHSLYIEEELRGKGYGEKLFACLTDAIKRENALLLTALLSLPEDGRGLGFLTYKGFFDERGLFNVYTFKGKAVKSFVARELELGKNGKLAFIDGREGGDIKSLEQMSEQELDKLKKGPAERFEKVDTFGFSGVDEHYSLAAFKDDEPVAVILVRKAVGKHFEIAWLSSISGGKLETARLIWSLLKLLEKEMPDDGELAAATVVEESEAVVKKLVEGLKEEEAPQISQVSHFMKLVQGESLSEMFFLP